MLVAIALAWYWLPFTTPRLNVELDSAELGFGNQKIILKPNNVDKQVAYSIWVELSTRKLGLDIDPEHDVIIEVYDSWYSFFMVTRELIKTVPATKLSNQSTRMIIELSIAVLNDGLRPHLTKWQARFRRWYERQLKDLIDVDPQTIQKSYPHYDELVEELLAVNKKLKTYRSKMDELTKA